MATHSSKTPRSNTLRSSFTSLSLYPTSNPWQILMSLLAKGIQTLTTSHHVQRCFPVWITIIFLWVFAGKDWEQEENWEAEDEMVGCHHQLNGHELEQALGCSEGQGSLVCCSPWGSKELESTMQQNWTEYPVYKNKSYNRNLTLFHKSFVKILVTLLFIWFTVQLKWPFFSL